MDLEFEKFFNNLRRYTEILNAEYIKATKLIDLEARRSYNKPSKNPTLYKSFWAERNMLENSGENPSSDAYLSFMEKYFSNEIYENYCVMANSIRNILKRLNALLEIHLGENYENMLCLSQNSVANAFYESENRIRKIEPVVLTHAGNGKFYLKASFQVGMNGYNFQAYPLLNFIVIFNDEETKNYFAELCNSSTNSSADVGSAYMKNLLLNNAKFCPLLIYKDFPLSTLCRESIPNFCDVQQYLIRDKYFISKLWEAIHLEYIMSNEWVAISSTMAYLKNNNLLPVLEDFKSEKYLFYDDNYPKPNSDSTSNSTNVNPQ